MKLHVVSDLHLGVAEYGRPFKVHGDVLVLAGDIVDEVGERALRHLADLVAPYKRAEKPIIYVMGNHEYYNRVLEEVVPEFRLKLASIGIRLLEDEHVDIDGVRLYGGTLWTDFGINGDAKIGRLYAEAALNDFNYIKTRAGVPQGGPPRLITGLDVLELHKRTLATMTESCVGWEGKKVVVTHHAPHRGSIGPRWRREPDNQLNSAFASDLSAFIAGLNPPLWIHGHMHDSFDYRTENGTRVVVNPRGYKNENRQFDPNLVVEV